MANVLPIENQKEILRAQRTRFLLVFAGVTLACALVCYLALIPTYLALIFGEVQADDSIASSASSTRDIAMMRDTKATIAQLTPVVAASTTPSEILSAVLHEKPAGVMINELTVTSGNPGKVVIVAKASRSDLIQTYRASLEADSHFDSVNIPVSALVGSANDDFTITLSGAF